MIGFGTEPGYEFDKTSLLEYNHMSFGGPPVKTETTEEEDELVRHDEKESKIGISFVLNISFPVLIYSYCKEILVWIGSWTFKMLSILPFFAEAEVLSAPPKLVYSKLVLR